MSKLSDGIGGYFYLEMDDELNYTYPDSNGKKTKVFDYRLLCASLASFDKVVSLKDLSFVFEDMGSSKQMIMLCPERNIFLLTTQYGYQYHLKVLDHIRMSYFLSKALASMCNMMKDIVKIDERFGVLFCFGLEKIYGNFELNIIDEKTCFRLLDYHMVEGDVTDVGDTDQFVFMITEYVKNSIWIGGKDFSDEKLYTFERDKVRVYFRKSKPVHTFFTASGISSLFWYVSNMKEKK